MKWIDVKDGLPNDREIVYLVWQGAVYYGRAAFYSSETLHSWSIYKDGLSYVSHGGFQDVTHWMQMPPLPALPIVTEV